MRAILLALALMTSGLVSGCATRGAGQDPSLAQGPVLAPVQVNTTSGATEYLRPQWVVGRWWDVDVSLDNGYGFLFDLRGKLVVGQAGEGGFRVGSDGDAIGTFDEYFDHFHIGDFDSQLRASIRGTPFEMFRWPLRVADSWTTRYVLMDTNSGPRPFNVTLTVASFEERPASERLRIKGESENGYGFDYDYSAATGWMTYFRLVNKTTGRIALSVDFAGTGLDYQGDVHHVRSQVLHERFVLSPPWETSYLGVPPVERVQVAAGFDWVEETVFLFVYPLQGAGAGHASFEIQRPDLTLDKQTFRHAGDTFGGNFTRITVRTTTAGTWGVALQAAGTAGAFAALMGFNSDRVAI